MGAGRDAQHLREVQALEMSYELVRESRPVSWRSHVSAWRDGSS